MTRTRLTAAERSEQLVDAAITAFATSGYAGYGHRRRRPAGRRLAAVRDRLFGSKQNLFIAAVEQACDRVEETFRQAARVKTLRRPWPGWPARTARCWPNASCSASSCTGTRPAPRTRSVRSCAAATAGSTR